MASQWPESTVVASVQANNSTAILPYLIDKVIKARINVSSTDGTSSGVRTLNSSQAEVFFGIRPDVFELTGTPCDYSLLLPVALPVELSEDSLQFTMGGAETCVVSIKGELGGAEQAEQVTATNTPAQTAVDYDLVLSITKPRTTYALTIQNLAGDTLLVLGPDE